MNHKHYTKEELAQMKKLRDEGASYKELADMFNRTEKAIGLKFCEMGWAANINTHPDKVKKETPPPRRTDEETIAFRFLSEGNNSALV